MDAQPAAHHEVEIVPVPHTVVATWPVGSFLENIVPTGSGDFIVSVHNHKELHRVTADGNRQRWVSMPASPAGMVVVGDTVFVVGGDPGQGPHHLYRVTADGDVHDVGPIADTLFLNGFTPGTPGIGYAVDSILGVVIAIELDSGASHVVVSDERLQKISPDPMLPGANGIKVGDDALYVTNTDRALVVKAPLDAAGVPLGSVDLVAEHVRGDDLAVASNGDLFITNHTQNTLIRLTTEGECVAVAGPVQGMAGSTACVFGTSPDDLTSLFVTTTGGMIMPIDGVVQAAKLVRLEVGMTGRPIGPSS